MQNAAALALAVALLVGALLTACTGKLAVMNEPPGMEFPPEKRTALMEVDCKAIRDPNVCTRTPGCAWVDLACDETALHRALRAAAAVTTSRWSKSAQGRFWVSARRRARAGL